MSLSIIIITKNEEQAIEDCLKSAAWADEIIVVDSGSTDATLEICSRYDAQIHVYDDWPGFGSQKNRALDLATGDWVLSLDADERITPELREEIESVMRGPEQIMAYDIPRLSSYCGRPMRHSGWWPDYVTRLFRKGCARFSNDLVHERLIVQGTTGRFQQHLIHKAFDNLEDVLETMNRYSTAGAQMMLSHGWSASVSTAILHGLWSFFHAYIFRAGFLDGREGFMLAVSNAEGTYYRYLKLMLLSEKMS